MSEKHAILIFLGRILNSLSNGSTLSRVEYPQTWWYVAHLKRWPRIQTIIQWCCRMLTGHELSRTEWGYGGGGYADRWCRWCNKLIKVPRESVQFTHPETAYLMNEIKEGKADE